MVCGWLRSRAIRQALVIVVVGVMCGAGPRAAAATGHGVPRTITGDVPVAAAARSNSSVDTDTQATATLAPIETPIPASAVATATPSATPAATVAPTATAP